MTNASNPSDPTNAHETIDGVEPAPFTMPLKDGPGTRIGPYKILQQIGEGGMGTVYMAEQEVPVRRRVAIKLIKPGMDTSQVVARMEAERQALALMDHPNIAKVLDAGTSASGRPYFVMELVKGISITKFCDEQQLTPRERLELFLPVCHAIQHAHQKGIIHRDIKPSNVLVAMYDDRPVPKIIDFGVAKATGEQLTDRTMFTEFGAIVGTIEYMSPEQARLNALDIDTRTDIYSLGVMLYELLTGSPPFVRKQLREAPLDEMLRIIREDEPHRPSTRVSSLKTEPMQPPLAETSLARVKYADGRSVVEIAKARKTDPLSLSKMLRGELDWIVMKALEKDRTRRYETANGLARDIQRYLQDEPVEACPPTAVYRLRKFAHRHKAGLTTAVAIGTILLVGAIVSAWQAVRATRAEQLASRRLDEVEQANTKTKQALLETRRAQLATERALQSSETARLEAEQRRRESEATSQFLVSAFRKPDPSLDGRTLTVAELLNQAEQDLSGNAALPKLTKAAMYESIGLTYLGLGLSAEAIRCLEQARDLYLHEHGEQHVDTLAAMNNLATAYRAAGRLADAMLLYERTRTGRIALLGKDHLDALSSTSNLAIAYRDTGRTAEAMALLEEVLQLCNSRLGADEPLTLQTMNNLAGTYLAMGKIDEALALYKETHQRQQARLGTLHADTLVSLTNLAMVHWQAGKLAEALQLMEEALRLRRDVLGLDHPSTLQTLFALATLRKEARRDDALPLFEEAMQRRTATFGRNHPLTMQAMGGLAAALLEAGKTAAAVELLEQTLALRRSRLGSDHTDTIGSINQLAVAYQTAGRLEEALPLFEEAYRGMKARLGPDNANTQQMMSNLALAYQLAGDYAKAEPLLTELVSLQKRSPKGGDLNTSLALAMLGRNYLKLQNYTAAETALRECLAIREQRQPGKWHSANTNSQLGEALAGQKKFAEAEPLLTDSYRALLAMQSTIPTATRGQVLKDAVQRLVQLYTDWEMPEKADAWRKELPSEEK